MVLARRSDVVMASRPSPVELLAALRDDHGYLFMLEIDANSVQCPTVADIGPGTSSGTTLNDKNDGTPSWLRLSPRQSNKDGDDGRIQSTTPLASPVAFLGCTPEQLFEVRPLMKRVNEREVP